MNRTAFSLALPIAVAAMLWFVMFSPWTAPHLNFWWSMLFSASALIAMSAVFGRDWLPQFRLSARAVVIGLVSAVVLWGVFYLGHALSTVLFSFAQPQIGAIYGLRDGSSHLWIALLLLFVVGPAETIFWQGFVQRNLMTRWGDLTGFAVTTLIYTLVHLWSFNAMLLMAAAMCGLFWGGLYMLLKPRNLWPLLISHAVWDVMVFILFPIV
ncbi:MAG: CPBP family intramembrane metalloprotease [Burkholderiales bacterium]|jgi:membrane protease YdiL (CAAX protease family)|nr:CPBP family intramembrane metalloprotease [Burkholderiales bacterium]